MSFDERTNPNNLEQLKGQGPQLVKGLALSDASVTETKQVVSDGNKLSKMNLENVDMIVEKSAKNAFYDYQVWAAIYNDLNQENISEEGLTLSYINGVIDEIVERKALNEEDVKHIRDLAPIMVNKKAKIMNRAKNFWHLSGGDLHRFYDRCIGNAYKSFGNYYGDYYTLLDNASHTLWQLTQAPQYFVQPFWMGDLVQYEGIWYEVLATKEDPMFPAGKKSTVVIYNPLALTAEQDKNVYGNYLDYQHKKETSKMLAEMFESYKDTSPEEKDPKKLELNKLFEDDNVFKQVSGTELAAQNPVFNNNNRWV